MVVEKTYFVCSILSQLIHEPFQVFIICKAQNQDSYKTLEKWCEKKKIPCEYSDTFTDEIFEQVVSSTEPKFVLMDDLASDDNVKNLLKTYKFGRHSHTFIVTLCQDYKSIPKEVRNNITTAIIFPLSSPFVARCVINSMGAFADQESLKMAYRFINIPENKFSCIFLQLDSPNSFVFTKDKQILDLNSLTPIKCIKQFKNKPKNIDNDEESGLSEDDEEEENPMYHPTPLGNYGRNKKTARKKTKARKTG